MPTEQTLHALISECQKLAQFNWLPYVLTTVITWLGAFALSYLNQKGRNRANDEDFQRITEQLAENTQIVREIESSISEDGWIRQQIWLKKQDSYEAIFLLLLDIKKYVSHQVDDFEEWLYVNQRHPYFGHYPHEENGNIDTWEKDKEEYERRKESPENKATAEQLKTKYHEALSKIFDHIDTKAIYLDSDVEKEIKKLKQSLGTTNTWEDWEEHFNRISQDTKDTLSKIRDISKVELRIK